MYKMTKSDWKTLGLWSLTTGVFAAGIEAIVGGVPMVGNVPDVNPQQLHEMLTAYMAAKAFVTFAAVPPLVIGGVIAIGGVLSGARQAGNAITNYVAGHYHSKQNRQGDGK